VQLLGEWIDVARRIQDQKDENASNTNIPTRSWLKLTVLFDLGIVLRNLEA
jgi:hypothetical protein